MSEQSYVPLNVGEGYFSDWQPPISVDDGKTWVWNHAQQKYVPQALSAGVTDHALLTHLDFASSGHTGFEQAGAGAAAVAAHVGLADSHSQYLLASGIRNGAATIVASGINATPLTLKLASGQVADGLRVADASDNDLMFVGTDGWVRSSRVISGNNAANENYNYNSDGYVDFGGVFQRDIFGVVHVVNDLDSYLYNSALNAALVIDDRSAAGNEGYAYGVNGFLYLSSLATKTPYSAYGLSFGVSNYSARPSDLYGAYLYAIASISGTTGNMLGLYSSIDNAGAGTVGYGVTIQVDKPFSTGGHYSLLAGIDVTDFSGYANATSKYALRTQGGQVLHQAGVNTVVPLVAQQAASANDNTADAIQAKNSVGTVQFAVGALGRIKTNQATANTHTPSGATAKQLPIYDAAGFLLGYIPIYGSAW